MQLVGDRSPLELAVDVELDAPATERLIVDPGMGTHCTAATSRASVGVAVPFDERGHSRVEGIVAVHKRRYMQVPHAIQVVDVEGSGKARLDREDNVGPGRTAEIVAVEPER
ncbi:MAG: hypothetical protein OXL38_17870 [Gammaproteobacteria bacterium]|nr:hypothetical protein [Gammaproteobacteria bacterium]